MIKILYNQVTLNHTLGNMCADGMAKIGTIGNDILLYWDNPPSVGGFILVADSMGIGSPRF